MMDDLISRQAAIDAFKPYVEYAKYDSNRTNAEWVQRIEMVLRYLPSAQPEYKMDEWCTDCREYDQERHCCPRFNKVIRETVEEYKAEHPEPCDDPRADVYYLAEKIGIHQLYALVVELRGEPAQPEITDEQAIEHLQASGWMQNHDKQMCEMGLRERLYDALFPSAQPEPCEDAVSRKDVVKFLDDWMSALNTNCHQQSVADLKIIKKDFENLSSVTPKRRWILCVDGNEPKANADCWISTNAKYVRRASYAPKANNQPNGFIVTEGGFGFYEYGKSAKAWMPYEEPAPYREEGGE